jgi:hypothetical protein
MKNPIHRLAVGWFTYSVTLAGLFVFSAKAGDGHRPWLPYEKLPATARAGNMGR